MKNTDAELIQRVLDGDDTAFSNLVNKYRKSVHALAWRKVQDFHIAEDITQETFLRAYRRLSSLKEPHSFASWLYVIATNQCKTWLSKKRLWDHSLEDTVNTEWEKATYSNYVIKEKERVSVEAQRDVVKKLLAKLPESDRTVITLYYLGGMTYEEISKFLGVSVNTIKSRLYRARQFLKKEEPMIREALENYQITPNLTDNIMQEISHLKPIPSTSKPLVPWAVATASAILIVLMLGIGSQNLVRFQQPYTLDAQAETSIELVDAPIVLNIDIEPDIHNQLGNTNALGISENDGQQPEEVLLAAAQVEGDDISIPKQQWIQSTPLAGSTVEGLLATSQGVIYTIAHKNLYKLQDDKEGWQHVSDVSSITDVPFVDIPMAEWENILYMLPSNELYASNNDGKTWHLIHQFPVDYMSPKALLLMENAFYTVFERGSTYRSENEGMTWMNIDAEFPSEPDSIFVVQDHVIAFAGGNLYRLSNGSWKLIPLEFPIPSSCFSITTTKDRIYALTINARLDPNDTPKGQRSWWIFRSDDLGNSWKNITPTHVWKERVGWLMTIRLVAAGETLMAMEQGMVRSTDGGDTWLPLQGFSPPMFSNSPVAVVNERTFYFGSWDYGLQRTTDGGKSWDAVNVTPENRRIGNIIVSKENDRGQNTDPIIYGSVGEMVQTTNGGKSWDVIPADIPMTSESIETPPEISHIVKSDGVIYAKGSSLSSSYSHASGTEETHIFRLSTDGNKLVPIQDIPVINSTNLYDLLNLGAASRGSDRYYAEMLRKSSAGATQFFKQLAKMNIPHSETFYRNGAHGAFTVSDNTFYMEYNFKLFRWQPGDTVWQDTGQEETVELIPDITKKDLQLAVSGNIVYVGKRDGHLVVSFDRGDNWIDITSGLPLHVNAFNDIVVAGSTVYVATDTGTITSDDGRNWRTVTDAAGANLIMEHLAADGEMLYGINNHTGIYRLKNHVWEQVVSDAPDNVNSLAVDGRTLYVGTQDRSMLHFTLEK